MNKEIEIIRATLREIVSLEQRTTALNALAEIESQCKRLGEMK